MEKVLIMFALNPLKAPVKPSVLIMRNSKESICHLRNRRASIIGSARGSLRTFLRDSLSSLFSGGSRVEGGSACSRVFTVSSG